MSSLNIVISRLFKAVQASSSSPAIQWMMRILALSQAISPAGWPNDYHLQDGEVFDFVVVGAGSAGATVAARLSEIRNQRILLIEAGGDPPLASIVPSLFITLMGTEYDWYYNLKLDSDIGKMHKNHTAKLMRGKMLGGSSSLNYEMYARGEAKDFEEWNKIAPGWDWNTVLYYFKKLENMTDPTVMNNPFDINLHSTEGPVKVSRPTHNAYFRTINELLLNSYEEIGLKRVSEMNGVDSLGVTLPHFTFADGRRSSTAESYLISANDRPNFYVAKYTRVIKILIDPFKLNAYGVKVITASGKQVKVYAKKEIVLSAGSIDTPKLLMLSGIGPKENLEKLYIRTVVDLPVGKNMQDHASIPLIFSGERGLESSLQHIVSATELNSFPAPVQSGFFNLNKYDGRRQLQFVNVHIGAFASPVIKLGCNIVTYKREFCTSIAKVNLLNAMDVSLLILLHPVSRGRVTLQSNNPFDDPIINSGLLNREEDIDVLVGGVKFLERLVNTSYFRSVKGNLEKLNVPDCWKFRFHFDKYWRCYVKTTVASMQHPVATCAMGPNGVVDERLRVHGVNGLRVVDASVMPLIPGGNTNAPAIMIGEKGADIIKEDYWL